MIDSAAVGRTGAVELHCLIGRMLERGVGQLGRPRGKARALRQMPRFIIMVCRWPSAGRPIHQIRHLVCHQRAMLCSEGQGRYRLYRRGKMAAAWPALWATVGCTIVLDKRSWGQAVSRAARGYLPCKHLVHGPQVKDRKEQIVYIASFISS